MWPSLKDSSLGAKESSKRISGWHGHALLCQGHVTEVSPHPREAGRFCPLLSLWNVCVFIITSLTEKLQMSVEEAQVHIIALSNLKEFSHRHCFCEWQRLRL